MRRMCISPHPLKGGKARVQNLEVLLSCKMCELLVIKEKRLMWKKYSFALSCSDASSHSGEEEACLPAKAGVMSFFAK